MGGVDARQFLNRVKEKTGINPVIYMSGEVTRQFNWSSISNTNPLWVAQYASMSPTSYQSEPWTDGKGYGAWSSAAIHQYSSSGILMNWNGQLDLNLVYIDASQWKELVSGIGTNTAISDGTNSNNIKEYEEEEMYFIKTVDTKRIYQINAGMWTSYQRAFPNAPVIPLYQSEIEKLIVKIFRKSSRFGKYFFVLVTY